MSIVNYTKGAEGFINWAEEFCYIPIFVGGMPVWWPIKELPTVINPDTGRCSKDMWDFQKELARTMLQMKNGKFVHKLIILCWMRGEGKCMIRNSLVLMYNGELKKVQDVKIGDLLMGDDNTPRKVLSLASGKEEMFEVTPNRGEPFTCTLDHKLSLKRVDIKRKGRMTKEGIPYVDPYAGNIVDISVKDYMNQSKFFKRMHLLYRKGVEFPEQKVNIDPYYLGMWLGDGSSNTTEITTMDSEVVNFIHEYSLQRNLRVSDRGKEGENKARTYRISGLAEKGIIGCNSLLNDLREYDLLQNKHIPQVYKVNSREVRLKVLAGLVDSDGHINRNSVQITLKSEQLSKDILFLARSLGFHAEMKKTTKTIKELNFEGVYYCIGISGDCSIIPTLIKRKKIRKRSDWKDVLVTGIKEIKSVGEQEYYGFMLDGNHRYLTGDFTVTHNSLIVCLIQLWKFFNFPAQKIMLGANSKEQVKFVHFDIIRDIILNSPKLIKIVGSRNVQEKEIRLKNKKGDSVSVIRSISSFSGIVSNITGYTFSEMFDMKNPRFFTQLDGSIRNIPNALGIIDSTVSSKEHILYHLYKSYKMGLDPSLFFSHRQSVHADYRDYTNPEMTQEQLNSYKVKFPPREFAMYFRNTWESGSVKMFSEATVMARKYVGVDGHLGMHKLMMGILNKYCEAKANAENEGEILDINLPVVKELSRLIPIEKIYRLKNSFSHRVEAGMMALDELSSRYDTNFALCVGVDRADPMKIDIHAGARTIVTLIAKGLPGSKSNPFLINDDEEDTTVQKYLYFLIDLVHIAESDINTIKHTIEEWKNEYDGIDTLCTERWGMWDIGEWCEENDITFDPITATYALQSDGFSEFFNIMQTGRFKAPELGVSGSKSEDILEEELLLFDHDPDIKFYGSPEKTEKFGTQDDAVYSANWGIYGGRFLTVMDFRPRNIVTSLGEFYENKSELVGKY